MSDAPSSLRVLVTGGTRGIGRAVVERFSEVGADVVYTGSSSSSTRLACGDFRSVNLASRSDTSQFASTLRDEHFDVLVNCAGINRVSPFVAIDDSDFDEVLEVNLRGPMVLTRALLPQMIARNWGRVVNVTSIFGVVSRAHRASYSASKFGLEGLTAALAAEVAPHGVLANSVAPGIVETDLTREVLGETGMADAAKAIPIGRLARPAEIAEVVVWLAGPRNTYISGQTILVDGGYVRI